MSEAKQKTVQQMVTVLKEMKNGEELERQAAAYAHGLYDGYMAAKQKEEEEKAAQ